jgi:hypothetical protein
MKRLIALLILILAVRLPPAGAQRGNDSMLEVGSQFIGVGKPAQFHQEVSRISQMFPCLKRVVNVYSVVW